jgi:hypothetical protein
MGDPVRRSLTKGQKRGILFNQRGDCPWCGLVLNLARHDFEIDHATPLALGGEDTLANMQMLHVWCHREKTHGNEQGRIQGDIKKIAKAKRVRAKHEGTWPASKNPIPGHKHDTFKRKIGGRTVRRQPKGSDHV